MDKLEILVKLTKIHENRKFSTKIRKIVEDFTRKLCYLEPIFIRKIGGNLRFFTCNLQGFTPKGNRKIGKRKFKNTSMSSSV